MSATARRSHCGGPGPDDYDPAAFPPFAVAVDVAVFTLLGDQLSSLLIERSEPPYAGSWALPGGFVRPDEDLHQTAVRELAEETGLTSFSGHLEQLRTYGSPDRDPRMRVVSVSYVAFAPDLPEPAAGTDARRARWWPVDDLDIPGLAAGSGGDRRHRLVAGVGLAFDHARILADAVDRVASKIEYTPAAAGFCPAEFTLGELQHVYEAVWGVPLPDRANFRRKVLATPGFVEVASGRQRLTGGQGRPAQLFRAGTATELNPPIKRPAGARASRSEDPAG